MKPRTEPEGGTAFKDTTYPSSKPPNSQFSRTDCCLEYSGGGFTEDRRHHLNLSGYDVKLVPRFTSYLLSRGSSRSMVCELFVASNFTNRSDH
ncbi:hypothetical protein [Lepagella muris]|uniref:Uncharacterized protein n=1 Tax=Lepagella muris TaxID=3032870 RepID=A0AC61RE06_9BACT|nr:hypothetical protein [Lepagella muris]TGY76840.1 hypothetical protein E5331_17195 [Lepagella muris]THG48284.1 hypothetical protein E5984_16455 [Bacteroidales bacterium]TKC57329.1 hypothetical protein E5359_011715 [Bacteroidales bacterium]